MIKSVIYGCSGLELTDAEKSFFKKENPLGFILFSRNIEDPDQVRNLISSWKDCISHDYPLILVDQEGGRVARFREPNWPKMPPASSFAKTAETNIELAERDVYDNYLQCANNLRKMGVNVNCAPALDVLFDGSDDIIGDRSFGSEPEQISVLGKACADGLMAGSVLPVIKHIPGHGRAQVDSHKELPIIDTPIDELKDIDFKPFYELSHYPLAMTAHIIYSAIDDKSCVTHSKKCVKMIREQIGFKGLLMTDDISMHALCGSFSERSEKSYEAGCDIILHCNGKMSEMKGIAKVSRDLNKKQLSILKAALSYEETPYRHVMNA